MSDSNRIIEENILQASEGNTQALQKVFSGLLSGPLYVPNRAQSHNLSHQPKYPNDFISVLGIQDKERIVVPVFTTPEFIQEWFGSELLYKKYTGQSLIEILPEGWWVTVNPGQEVEKEISPWEISRLKHGEQGIKEVLEEAALDEAIIQSIELKQVPDNEFLDLKQKITEYASANKAILKIYLMIEKGLTTDGETIEKLLVGIECSDTIEDLEPLKDQLSQLCSINLIGNIDSKILAGTSGNNIILGPFKNCIPFYTAGSASNRSIFSYLKSVLRR